MIEHDNILQYRMPKDNTLSILEQFFTEQKEANDLFYKVVIETSAETRRKLLYKFSEQLISYLEFKQKYEHGRNQ